MRKISKIILINWQKHDKLEISLNDGLNIITGETDTGKTCIFRALQWIHGMSNLSEKDYRREGTTETSVSIVYDDGFIVERIRSKSINRYILKKDGVDDLVFDAVGKDIPQEIKVVLEVENISIDNNDLSLNFAEQENLNFILDNSVKPSYRAKLFNKFTGNELIDKLFKHLNKEALSLSKKLKKYNEDFAIKKQELVEVRELKIKLFDEIEMLDDLYNDLTNDIEYYNELKILAEHRSSAIKTANETKEKLDKIACLSDKTIKETKETIEKLYKLRELDNEHKVLCEDIAVVEEKVKLIKTVDIDFSKIKETCERLDVLSKLNATYLELVNDKEYSEDTLKEIKDVNLETLNKLVSDYNQLQELKIKHEDATKSVKKTSESINVINENIKALDGELKSIWDKVDVCPLCKQKIKKS